MPPNQSRPVATTPDTDFTLSIDDALESYAKAGLPRTPRSVQRYCAKGHLQCRLVETGTGDKWLITPESVAKHIAYIEETVATGRDMTRQVATGRDNENNEEVLSRQTDRTELDKSRQVATTLDSDVRYVTRLESEVDFLRGQVETKDSQIKELTERSRETNHLIAGLQRALNNLLPAPKNKNADTVLGSNEPLS